MNLPFQIFLTCVIIILVAFSMIRSEVFPNWVDYTMTVTLALSSLIAFISIIASIWY